MDNSSFLPVTNVATASLSELVARHEQSKNRPEIADAIVERIVAGADGAEEALSRVISWVGVSNSDSGGTSVEGISIVTKVFGKLDEGGQDALLERVRNLQPAPNALYFYDDIGNLISRLERIRFPESEEITLLEDASTVAAEEPTVDDYLNRYKYDLTELVDFYAARVDEVTDRFGNNELHTLSEAIAAGILRDLPGAEATLDRALDWVGVEIERYHLDSAGARRVLSILNEEGSDPLKRTIIAKLKDIEHAPHKPYLDFDRSEYLLTLQPAADQDASLVAMLDSHQDDKRAAAEKIAKHVISAVRSEDFERGGLSRLKDYLEPVIPGLLRVIDDHMKDPLLDGMIMPFSPVNSAFVVFGQLADTHPDFAIDILVAQFDQGRHGKLPAGQAPLRFRQEQGGSLTPEGHGALLVLTNSYVDKIEGYQALLVKRISEGKESQGMDDASRLVLDAVMAIRFRSHMKNE